MRLTGRIAVLEVGASKALAARAEHHREVQLVLSDPVALYLFSVYHRATEPMVAADPEGRRGMKWRLALLKDKRAKQALDFYLDRLNRLEGQHDNPLHLDCMSGERLAIARQLLLEVAELPGGPGAVDLTEWGWYGSPYWK